MPEDGGDRLTIALCGDLMIGRGIDQVLPDPCPPHLHERYVRDARDYVELAERASGPLARPVGLDYPWGDALGELSSFAPEAFVVNLETALTRCEDAWPHKGINYRASPENARMLREADVTCCALANNHVLDWGHGGLRDTLATLDALGVLHAGAGTTREEAEAPAAITLAGGGRLLVHSFATGSSGVPEEWAAADARPGVALLPDLSEETCRRVVERMHRHRRPGDLVIASIHWGGTWGYALAPRQRAFAHALVSEGGVDVVHGHSSHHPQGIEIHRGRLVVYGCGDLLNDYEGIGGHERFRAELGVLLLATLDRAHGTLLRLVMSPTRIARLQVTRAGPKDTRWLSEMLHREGRDLGTSAVRTDDGRIELRARGVAEGRALADGGEP